MDSELLKLLYDVSLRVRLLKAWENAHAPYAPQYAERELLALEFMEHMQAVQPVTETVLAEVFGLATSSASELVRKLTAKDAIERTPADEADARQKPLKLTKEGRAILNKIKVNSAERYDYLMADLTDSESKVMANVLGKMNDAVVKQIARRFNRSI